MAESVASQLSFSKLLSHTFPGIFIALGIFMIIDLVFHDDAKGEFKTIIFQDWKTFLGAITFLIFLGTIFGVIIDSIHHLIEGKLDKFKAAEKFKKSESEIFKDKSGNNVGYWYFVGFLPQEKVEYLSDAYYCYLECDFNLSLSFFFSAFIYSSFLFLNGYKLFEVGIVFFYINYFVWILFLFGI